MREDEKPVLSVVEGSPLARTERISSEMKGFFRLNPKISYLPYEMSWSLKDFLFNCK